MFRGSGGLFYALNHPVSPTKRPNAKRKSKTKAFFDLLELISPSPSTCPITALVDPTRPPSRILHPPAASGCARGGDLPLCRSTPSTSALNRTFHPHIRPPHPCFRASTPRRFALQGNERMGVRTQRIAAHIRTRTPCMPTCHSRTQSIYQGVKQNKFLILA